MLLYNKTNKICSAITSLSKNKISIQIAPPSNIIAELQFQERREKDMYIMHENVSFYFQWSIHVELSPTYLQTWCTRLTFCQNS